MFFLLRSTMALQSCKVHIYLYNQEFVYKPREGERETRKTKDKHRWEKVPKNDDKKETGCRRLGEGIR